MQRWFDHAGRCNVHQTVMRETNLPGVLLNESRYHFKSGSEWCDVYPELELHYVLGPHKVPTRVWNSAGDELRLGRLVLFPPDVTMHARISGTRLETHTFCCRFDQQLLEELSDCSFEWASARLPEMLDLRNPHIEQAMRRLAYEMFSPTKTSPRLMDALCAAIIVDLAREYGRDRGSPNACEALSDDLLRVVQELVFDAHGPMPGSAEIADACGLKVGALRRAFRSATGETLFSYLENAKLTRACDMLSQTDTPLKMVSFLLGFAQPSAFSYFFRRRMNESPRIYRMRNGGGDSTVQSRARNTSM